MANEDNVAFFIAVALVVVFVNYCMKDESFRNINCLDSIVRDKYQQSVKEGFANDSGSESGSESDSESDVIEQLNKLKNSVSKPTTAQNKLEKQSNVLSPAVRNLAPNCNFPSANDLAKAQKEKRKPKTIANDGLNACDLLPKTDEKNLYSWLNPKPKAPGVDPKLQGCNFIEFGRQLGISTVSQSLRNANYQIRSEPIIEPEQVGPWCQSTIVPDVRRRKLDFC